MAGLDRGDGLVAGCSWDHVAFGDDGAEGDAAEADAPGISVAVVRATVVRTRPKACAGPTLVADVLVACLAAAASRLCWLTFNSLDWGCRSRAASNRPVYSIRVDRLVSGGIFSTPPDLLPTAAHSGRDQAGARMFCTYRSHCRDRRVHPYLVRNRGASSCPSNPRTIPQSKENRPCPEARTPSGGPNSAVKTSRETFVPPDEAPISRERAVVLGLQSPWLRPNSRCQTPVPWNGSRCVTGDQRSSRRARRTRLCNGRSTRVVDRRPRRFHRGGRWGRRTH